MAFGKFKAMAASGVAHVGSPEQALEYIKALRPELRDQRHWKITRLIIQEAIKDPQFVEQARRAFRSALREDGFLVEEQS